MKSMGYDINTNSGGLLPYFSDSWGIKSNWNSLFSINQHLPVVQEKVTIKPTSCIEQGTEDRQPSVHQKLKCP